MSAIKA
jgi:hypothetical protein